MILKDDGCQKLLQSVRAAGFSGVEPTFGLEATLPNAATKNSAPLEHSSEGLTRMSYIGYDKRIPLIHSYRISKKASLSVYNA